MALKNHPDWRVRVRRKFFVNSAVTKKDQTNKTTEVRAADSDIDKLAQALGSLYAKRKASLLLSAGYVASKNPAESLLRLSMQIDPRLFVSQLESVKHKAELDVLGAAVDDRGVICTFKQVLSITPNSLSAFSVVWHQQLIVPAGLYQVRVAVRERKSGWTGSAMEWLEVPKHSVNTLHMSSLFIAARQDVGDSQASTRAVKVSVDRKFTNNSVLRFQTYVYPPAPQTAEIDIHAEVLRNGTRVLNVPTARVPNNISANQPGLPYWCEISLAGLTPGRYLLRVTATDHNSSATTSEQLAFTIE